MSFRQRPLLTTAVVFVVWPLVTPVLAQDEFGGNRLESRNLAAETAWAIKRSQEKTPIPRRPDGKPDLTGSWVQNGADPLNILEEHPGGFGVLGGPSMIVDPPDGKIPYQPWALAERDRHRRAENHWEDGRLKCSAVGVPRNMLFGFNAFFTKDYFVRYAGGNEMTFAARLNGKHELPEKVRELNGDQIAYWDGDTLVVDTTNTTSHWLAIGGDFISEAAHVVERFTMLNRDTLIWEATITDPKVFTRPWTMRFPAPWTRGRDRDGGDGEDSCNEGNFDVVHFYKFRDQYRQRNGQ